MENWIKRYSGVGLTLVIAAAAYALGNQFKIVGGSIFAILLGIALSFVKRPAYLEDVIRFSSKKLLQAAIILLGFEMDLVNVVKTGSQSLLVMLVTIAVALLVAVKVGRWMGVTENAKILVGVGTSICGGSAIAATAPVIGADDEDVASALSTIFLFNIIAVFLFPALGRWMHISDAGFGVWAGTAINDTSSVVAAGYTFSEAAGNTAVIVKLARTLMIIPITLALSLLRSKHSGSSGAFQFSKVFPWFVAGFLLTAVITTTGLLPAQLSKQLVQIGKFLIIMAMAAIGLNTNLKKLLTQGRKSILLGLCCWFAVAVSALFMEWALGML